MGIFSNQYANQGNPQTPKALLLSKYRIARSEVLLVLIFTVINVALLILKTNYYFLFSLTVPYYGVVFGSVVAQEYGIGGFLVAGIVFALIMIAVYFVLYFLSKKRSGCMTAILVLFSIDTLALLGVLMIEISSGGFSSLFDIAVHALVLYYLIRGVSAASQLKKLGIDVNTLPAAMNADAPTGSETVYTTYTEENGRENGNAENEQIEPEQQSVPYQPDIAEETPEEPEPVSAGAVEYKTEPECVWDGDGKIRLAAIYDGIEVKAVRKFSRTELVVDGKVYSSFDKIIESGYTLAAEVNGIKFVYSHDGFGGAVLSANGEELATGTFL